MSWKSVICGLAAEEVARVCVVGAGPKEMWTLGTKLHEPFHNLSYFHGSSV